MRRLVNSHRTQKSFHSKTVNTRILVTDGKNMGPGGTLDGPRNLCVKDRVKGTAGRSLSS